MNEETIKITKDFLKVYFKHPEKVVRFIVNQQQELDKYKNIVDEAIEYINENCFNNNEYDTHGDMLIVEELISILKGE